MERYIGKMLDSRYEILEVIGTGGMAVVFKAKCHRLNRLVAIKMLKKDLSEDPEFRRRFHDESQAVAMLSHPNIMAVYDVSRGGDMDYIVMELIDGINLKQYMERRGRLNWPESLHFIAQVMKGLSHAHSRGIVHRDIKPQNIMVLRDGTVKVTDFGIATLINNANSATEVIGSVHYISPEQARGEHTDNRSDIYSAGVVLYEMLTSRLPFDGDNPLSVAIQHFSAVPVPPREIDPEIPEALDQICRKAMMSDRGKRYATADEMVADLEVFRKDPNVSFDYSVEALQTERTGEDEPTQFIPNVAVTRGRQTASRYVQPTVDEAEEYEEKRPGFSWLKPLILIAICCVVGYFAVTKIYNSIMESFTLPEIVEYTVPSVVGHTVEEAAALEEVVGIFQIVEIKRENNREVPAGKIISQDPLEGERKKPVGEDEITINVTVSLGAYSGIMPGLIGMTRRSAELYLDQNKDMSKLGLMVKVSAESEYSEEYPEGCVVRTIPAENEPLEEGDEVILILSKGPRIIYHEMPDCKGQSMEWVQNEMNRRNIIAAFRPVEGSQEVGQVLTQSVDKGEQVAEGSTVTFTYSDGEKLLERTMRYTTPSGVDDMMVEIYLDDTLVFESMLAPDFTLEQNLYAKTGTYQLRIFVDGILQENREISFSE